MKFESWKYDKEIIRVSGNNNNHLGFIHYPHSEHSSFFTPAKGSEITLDEMRRILAYMEPIPAEPHVEGQE